MLEKGCKRKIEKGRLTDRLRVKDWHIERVIFDHFPHFFFDKKKTGYARTDRRTYLLKEMRGPRAGDFCYGPVDSFFP